MELKRVSKRWGQTSNSKEIDKEVKANKELINKQVELYKPDIIICCGRFDSFVDIFLDAKKGDVTDRGVRYLIYEDKLIISYAHPAARIRYAYMHYALIDALREILKINVDEK